MPLTTTTAPRTPGAGPRRLFWHRLILGLWYRPVEVLDEARDRSVWGAAMFLCLLCGALGTLAKDSFWAQWDVSPSLALQAMAIGSAVILLASVLLGLVTHAIARRLGGNGRVGPTASLFVLVFWTTDLPRLVLDVWMSESSVPVRAAASVTTAFGCALATLLIRGQHHLPTRKAVASVSIQMVAVVALLKFPPGSG
ncbi:YIP1 family protein [Streptomyces sp. AV19]|uniref:YIP1 family protein n=1 Tax=Streptomyces sp. AV19 TaxID=2793068 RepID=UPI0018FE0DC1|nr:YIP1 family protein [Streptomyces sp. AV19]MBH1937319.1 YIP1 family protein [Streptomyces sp. AV19]MDG4536797.1 YIP1 family protein [Streptomyces sp. AV19]